MSLDGLRAWVAEVERKLGKRTRVFLALAAIAIGIAGAAVYLAIDARESSVSESDVQALQDELEARSGTVPPTDLSGLEAQLQALQSEVAQLKSERGASGGAQDKGTSGGSGSGDASTGGALGSDDAADGGVSAGGASAKSPEEATDLLEEGQAPADSGR